MEAVTDAVAAVQATSPAWRLSAANPAPVSGVWSRGEAPLVIELDMDGHTLHMVVLRFVDTRSRGLGPWTWAVGWKLARGADVGGMPVLERETTKLVAWVLAGEGAVCSVCLVLLWGWHDEVCVRACVCLCVMCAVCCDV